MSMEDEIRQQKEQMKAKHEQEDRKEALRQEFIRNGFRNWTYVDGVPSPPTPVVPCDALKIIIDEAWPNIPFSEPMILRKLSTGKTYCRCAERNEQPDMYAFRWRFRGTDICIFENGLIAAWENHNISDHDVYENTSDSFASESSWLTPERIAEFRESLIYRIAEASLALERRSAAEAERERARAAHERENAQESSGCYVATCVYGSYDCPQVWTLRRFRDNTLANTWYGRAFIKCYYAVSPTLVRLFGDAAWFRSLWKPVLDRMVRTLNARGVDDAPYADKR